MTSSPLVARGWRLPALLGAVAAAVRVAVILWWRCDGLYGQDAFAYFQQAAAIAAAAPAYAPPLDFFWPNGYPLLAAAAMLVGGVDPLAAQLVALVCGCVTPMMLCLVGRELGAPVAGLVAAAAAALAALPVQASVVVMSDAPAQAFVTVAVWAALRARATGGQTGLVAVSAAAAALAGVTRWASLLALPAVAVLLTAGLARARRPLLAASAAVAVAVTVAAPQLLVMARAGAVGLSTGVAGLSPANLLASSFTTPDGELSYRLPNLVFATAAVAHPALMPLTLSLFVAVGAAVLWRRRQRLELLALGLWLAVPGAYFALMPMQNLRFHLTHAGAAWLLAGLGVEAALTVPRWRRATSALLVVSVLVVAAWDLRAWSRFFGRQAADRAAARLVAEMVPAGSTVLAFDLSLTLAHTTDLTVLDLFSVEAGRLAALASGREPLYVVVDPASLAGQWRERAPGRHLRWLAARPGWSEVAQSGRFTLFRLGAQAPPEELP